ncbi:hypothetical protein [Desulfonema magnum]|uniref:Transposase n=1 Tax=Desulfonema magnum TaxID=45655 RepID=A0A975BJD8_9BACT|nr:hypothetical protein [Desulfonema magnum]QTA86536.1 Uncharacterized protein dnm_025600 [Desulfonema magnum]
MAYKNNSVADQTTSLINTELLTDILRILSMLEKELNRVARRNCHNRGQYPEIFFQTESMLNGIRSWIKIYRLLYNVPMFNSLLTGCLKELSLYIGQLIVLCVPVRGKKGVRRARLIQERKRLEKSVEDMLRSIEKCLTRSETNETEIEFKTEEALIKAFEKHFSQNHETEIRVCVSGRGDKTYIFPWSDKTGYLFLVRNKKRFRSEVVDKLENYAHATGHRPACKCRGKYRLKGFRSSERKPVTEGGKQQNFPIRMVECADCGQRFSLIPSFLPREKHFGIDIIGRIVQGIVLFGQSLRGALENFKLTGTEIKSRQTILNWLRWFGTLHPATILTRAGIKGSSYFQEDEGFEKESGMRTYTVAMVDPENFLVWHLDYVDHVDMETLTESFEKFVERIDFKIIGVTKDRWQPATDALKSVCHRLWIGFCHLHCLGKFRRALSEYKKESGCSSKKVGKLYKEFRNILDSATSAANLKSKIGFLKDDAFSYPPVRRILNQVIEDGSHYTCHKRRKGIKRTTSLADNFLKIVKRKLRQLESFRDQECTETLFRAMANVRNFVPFISGAKNAHKSPFILARGQTFELPWTQIMNVHNAFLFTENAA